MLWALYERAFSSPGELPPAINQTLSQMVQLILVAIRATSTCVALDMLTAARHTPADGQHDDISYISKPHDTGGTAVQQQHSRTIQPSPPPPYHPIELT